MYPHERSLVKRLAGKPFVLVGVNSDPKERLKLVIQKEQMTWPSWWDGGNTEGAIARQWGVDAWPTLCLVDHKGIVRYRYVGSPGDEVLDRAIDGLVDEVKADTKK